MTTTTIRERPILFSGPMVRAILEGRKTMTRRIVSTDSQSIRRLDLNIKRDRMKAIKLCPYGHLGERLWVRETWATMPGHRPIPYPEKYDDKPAWYQADSDRPMWAAGKWRPSIFMPRNCSRITLEVTEVRAEPLQKITESDAIAEGMTARLLVNLTAPLADRADPQDPYWDDSGNWQGCYKCAKKKFKADHIDGGFSGENDSIPHCDTCGCLLDGTLTNYGIEQEIEHFREYPIKTPNDAWSLHRAMNAGGNPYLTETCGDWDYRPDLLGTVSRIGFRFLWDKLNGPRGYGWDKNPWVWVVSFKRIN